MSLAELPEIVQLQLTQFLLSADLFRLSHTSSYALSVFSSDLFWRPRLPASFPAQRDSKDSAKRAYLHQFSLVFYGSTTNGRSCNEFRWHGLSITRGDMLHVPLHWNSREAFYGALSFDLWFSLAPDEPGCVRGGILLGGQSHALVRRDVPIHHRQTAIVDTKGNLFCSIVEERKTPVATNLRSERWYHLALTWDSGYQCVYLDGVLVSELQGHLLREWTQLVYWQIGAGCISADSVAKPTANWNGWLGFRGMIDDFHVWNMALSREQIYLLGQQEDLGDGFVPAYSMKQAAVDEKHAQRVRCSRPLERLCCPLAMKQAAAF